MSKIADWFRGNQYGLDSHYQQSAWLPTPSRSPVLRRAGLVSRSPRRLDEDAVASFLDAANDRPPTRHIRADVRIILAHKDRRRWERMERDFAWMKREVDRLGLNPEDARWLL